MELEQDGFTECLHLNIPTVADAEVPARFAAAERTIEHRLWREDVARWENEVKPASIRVHLALQQVEPQQLSDDELIAHVDACRENQKRMIRQHHLFDCAALVPVGDLIAHLTEWTGLPMAEFLASLRGSAPESAGEFVELTYLASAVRLGEADLLDGDDAGVVLDRLRSQDGAVGTAATAYLDLVGHRLLDSIDTGSPTALEVPEVLVAGIRNAVESSSVEPADTAPDDSEVARLRDLVPTEHRDMFDELLDEARATSRLRDERDLYSDVWAGGITRRALLAAGRRLADAGRLERPTHLVEGGYAEIRSLLQGGGGPSALELAERAAFRANHRPVDMPPFLGDPPQPPPPTDGLPPGARRAMNAIGAAMDALFGSPGEPNSNSNSNSNSTIAGIGTGAGSHAGRARVVCGPEDFADLEPGDVLVATTTNASFNVVLPLVGAVVTDTGGLLSHAAIVCRESGIPAVVGCGDATSRINDGTDVRVDGTAGTVECFVVA